MNEITFFQQLQKDTSLVFQKSHIKLKQEKLKKKWNFAICETPIQIGKPLIFGLNWGGSKDYPEFQQYPPINKTKRDWPFINSIRKPLKDFAGINSIDEINYSNLCFFRSPNARYLTETDWELCLPLFKKYVEYINPSWCLLLGNSGIKYLNKDLTISDRIIITGKNKKIKGYKGTIFGNFNFKCVPHPNNIRFYPQNQVNELWKEMFENSIKSQCTTTYKINC